MNILLDTHIALWAITDNPNLSAKAREMILEPYGTIWVSTVSVWEIEIKHALGRGEMPVSAQEALNYSRLAGYHILAIEPEHATAIASLPNHHQDPFDRLLVSQALVEPIRLLTHDMTVAK